MVRVLFIDDDPRAQATLSMILAGRYTLLAACSAAEGLRALHDQDPDVVLLDIDLPDRDGLSLLEDIVSLPSPPPVIMLTAYGEVDFVKRAVLAGAFDYLLKDFSLKALDGMLQRAVQYADRRRGPQAEADPEALAGMIGESPPMRELKRLITCYAASDAPVLLLGESGSGKELAGAALHRLSPRRSGPWVPVNCGAIPDTLLESELFGSERGAFTDAVSRPGCFERANRGTIFLDEIGELAPAAQVKLLRVLESQELVRVGGTTTVRLNLRVIAATNKDLHREVERERFREDLYYWNSPISWTPSNAPALRFEGVSDTPSLRKRSHGPPRASFSDPSCLNYGLCHFSAAGLLIVDRRHVSQARVQPHPVVEHLDVLKDRRPSFLTASKRPVTIQLPFERLEKRFRRRVVPTIPFTAHALPHPVPVRPPAKYVAAVLGAPVGMKNQPFGWSATHHCHHQRLHHQIAFYPGAHRPPHDLARMQVQDRTQIQPSLGRRDIGDVRHPHPICSRHLESAVHQVRCDRQAVLGVRGGAKSLPASRPQPLLVHQTGHPIVSDPNPTPPQLARHPGTPVSVFHLLLDPLDASYQLLLHPSSLATSSKTPGVVPTA